MSKALTICVLGGFTEGDSRWIDVLRQDHTVVTKPNKGCDVVICGSINLQDVAFSALATYPKIPLVTYCWDFYRWAWDGKNPGYDWKKYEKLLRKSALILTPSTAQQRRLQELFNLSSTVIHASIPTYDAKTSDERFVLDPVRNYPEENLGWVERACKELDIPYVHSEHQFTQEEFRRLVSTCSFMTCGYREASTGGLTLMEGLWNGKASLVSDSPYMGAVDYLGEFGSYFKHDDYDDLKRWIKYLWDTPPKISKSKARKHISNYTAEAFVQKLIAQLYDIL